MKKWLLLFLVLLLIVLHQDYWNWKAAEPLAFGFLPIGLAYHVIYALACAGLMSLLVRFAWPTELESAAPETPEARRAEDGHE
jgi:hypothetical protein